MAFHSPEERATIKSKFDEYQRTRARALRNELIELHRQLAGYFARRYADRGEPYDDLLQVANLGLLKAVERFDPDRNIEFSTFAGATVEGELKRHFRDKTWAVRVPRGAQELHLRIRPATNRLSQQYGRAPTVAELATELDSSTEEVLQALEVGSAYRSSSLDAGSPDQRETRSVQKSLTFNDPNFNLTEHRLVVDDLLLSLPERERSIVAMRFFDELSQAEIAERIGISQMHVSRFLLATVHRRTALRR